MLSNELLLGSQGAPVVVVSRDASSVSSVVPVHQTESPFRLVLSCLVLAFADELAVGARSGDGGGGGWEVDNKKGQKGNTKKKKKRKKREYKKAKGKRQTQKTHTALFSLPSFLRLSFVPCCLFSPFH